MRRRVRLRLVRRRRGLLQVQSVVLVVERSPECPIRSVTCCLRGLHSVTVKLTVNRYSTARSGLKKAARRAASIWGRSKPIASILAIIPARSTPMAIELSLRFWPETGAWGPAGDGVAGGAAGAAALAVVGADVWDGAAGAAGVDVVDRAGVSGTALDEALGFG